MECHAEAMKWYRKAADQDFANAQYEVAMMYHQGTGVRKNRAEAKKWFRKAAANGCEEAKKYLK